MTSDGTRPVSSGCSSSKANQHSVQQVLETVCSTPSELETFSLHSSPLFGAVLDCSFPRAFSWECAVVISGEDGFEELTESSYLRRLVVYTAIGIENR